MGGGDFYNGVDAGEAATTDEVANLVALRGRRIGDDCRRFAAGATVARTAHCAAAPFGPSFFVVGRILGLGGDERVWVLRRRRFWG